MSRAPVSRESRAPDTGESTASIRRRQQERAWEQTQRLLATGGRLRRVGETRRWYVTPAACSSSAHLWCDGWGGLSDATVARLVAEKKLRPFLGGYVLPEGA